MSEPTCFRLALLTAANPTMEITRLFIATATGVRRCSSSNGMTGSAAHFSSTNKNTTSNTALVAKRPSNVGLLHLYASCDVELVLSEMAMRAAPSHPARRKQPRRSTRLNFW